MQIRDIVKEEKELFIAMAKEFYGSADACLFPANLQHLEETFVLCMEENPYARLLMLEDAGQPVGYGMLSFTWSNEAGGLTILLEELYIRADAQGKGYGSRFLSWLEQEYPKAKRFRLEATRNNTGAIGLYEKTGYIELPYYQMVKDREEH